MLLCIIGFERVQVKTWQKLTFVMQKPLCDQKKH
jgi:hypothetical protein